jgi:HAE1 family hydrophobic/amphiphilic exporter-1
MGIAIIYLLLVFLFESWTHPLAIMISLPVAVVGSFGMLWLTGHSLNMMSMMGLILVVGIVTKNAILLVDFTNELRREQAYDIKPALVQAGRLRLRPILMTTFALVFAMVPILLGQGAGAETRAPLAAVVIGGNVTSTLLTLIVVPVVYNILDVLTNFLGRLVGKKPGDEDRPSSETGSDTGGGTGGGPVFQPETAALLVDISGAQSETNVD